MSEDWLQEAWPGSRVGDTINAADMDWQTFKVCFGLPFEMWLDLRRARVANDMHHRMKTAPVLEVTAVDREKRSVTFSIRDPK